MDGNIDDNNNYNIMEFTAATTMNASHVRSFVTVQALEAGQNVTGKRGIGMANMGLVVDVIDRCRDVIGLFVPGHGGKSFAQVVKQNGPKWAVMVKISACGQ